MMSMLRLKAAGDTSVMNNLIRQNLKTQQSKNASDILAVSEVIQIKLYRGIVKYGSLGWLFLLGRSRFMAML